MNENYLTSINKNIDIINVSYSPYETIFSAPSVLTQVRREFFIEKKKIKKKENYNIQGFNYKYQYAIGADMPLQWKKLINNKVVEKSQEEPDNRYSIEVYDLNDNLIKKEYYSNDHIWKKTIYYKSNSNSPNITLEPYIYKDCLCLSLKENNNPPQLLLPCVMPENTREDEMIREMRRPPSVSVSFSNTRYYYAVRKEALDWYNALCEVKKKILELSSDSDVSSSTDKPLETKVEADTETDLVNKKKEISLDFSLDNDDLKSQLKTIQNDVKPKTGGFLFKSDSSLETSKNSGSEKLDLNTDSFDTALNKVVDPNEDEDSNFKINRSTYYSDDVNTDEKEDGFTFDDDIANLNNETENELVTNKMYDQLFEKEESVLKNVNNIVGSNDISQKQHFDYFINKSKNLYKAEDNKYNEDKKDSVSINDNDFVIQREEDESFVTRESVVNTQTVESEIDAFTQILAGKNTADKVIVDEAGNKFYYYGELEQDNRNGYGRTTLDDGQTAYEGYYKNDKRDGFGAYYYNNKKICYVGQWQENTKNGFGVSFEPDDSVSIGKFENNNKNGICADFDSKGNLDFVGNVENGVRNGISASFDKNDNSLIITSYKNGIAEKNVKIFDKDGSLIYTGEYMYGMKNGYGTQFSKDSKIIYKGNWLNNKYAGKGTLYLDNGEIIEGSFADGLTNGYAVKTALNGKIIYKGNWLDGLYHGQGKMYNEEGSYCEGEFKEGSPNGELCEYDVNGNLAYKGEWEHAKYHGMGSLYKDGVIIYEGRFYNGQKQGYGKEYSNGQLVYEGNFQNNTKNGFGKSFSNNKLVYVGLWKNGLYNGAGVYYKAGSPKYVGNFQDNYPEGRVNFIKNGVLFCECIYKNFVCEYFREYSDESDRVIFEGYVQNDLPNGMGCTFSEYGEKSFEGMFKDGKSQKAMRVKLKTIEPLDYVEELKDTDYEKFRCPCEYAIDLQAGNYEYTGQLKNGKPEGKGTIIYEDHTYTGFFKNGIPSGKGCIYLNNGQEFSGEFVTSDVKGAKILNFDGNIIYYVVLN